VKNGKNKLIYETQAEIFWLKFSLKLLKILFSAGKITKKKIFPTQPKKMIKSSKKKLPITVLASLKGSNRLNFFFFQIIDHFLSSLDIFFSHFDI
jgi:hypothetical protein